jgi:hypothetical protein
MDGYGYRTCNRGLMGPAMLVTFGVLALLHEFNIAHFHYTWPVLLIVAGLVKVLQNSGAAQPNLYQPPMAPPPAEDSGQVNHV